MVASLAVAACSSGGSASPTTASPSVAASAATAALVDQESIKAAGSVGQGTWTVSDTVSDKPYSGWSADRSVRPVSCTVVSQIGAGITPTSATSDGQVSSITLDQGSSDVFQYIVTGTNTTALSDALASALSTCKAYAWRADSGTTVNGSTLVDESTVTITNRESTPPSFTWSSKFKTKIHDCNTYKPSKYPDCAETSTGTYVVAVAMTGGAMVVTTGEGKGAAAVPAIQRQTLDRISKAQAQ